MRSLLVKSCFEIYFGMFWLVPVIEGSGGEGGESVPANKPVALVRDLFAIKISYVSVGVLTHTCIPASSGAIRFHSLPFTDCNGAARGALRYTDTQ
jgi:hypothetical protein